MSILCAVLIPVFTSAARNPRLMSRLPTPLVSLASHQLAGRGRGGNVWLSQSGGLQFSTLLRSSLSSFPASKLVFVQYLFALSVVEACRDESILGARGKAIRLKWPNDLYAVYGPGERERKKIGGILVNTSFTGGKIDIVVGKHRDEVIPKALIDFLVFRMWFERLECRPCVFPCATASS